MTTAELAAVPELSTELTSRWARSRVLQDEQGRRFYESYFFGDRPFHEEDAYHTVGAGEVGRLDLISFQYYQTTHLWWMIAEASGISDPIQDVVAGMVLRIPAPNQVFAEIMRVQRR